MLIRKPKVIISVDFPNPSMPFLGIYYSVINTVKTVFITVFYRIDLILQKTYELIEFANYPMAPLGIFSSDVIDDT